MVLITGPEVIQQGIASRKKILISVSLGIFCIIIPILCLAIDPLIILARTKLKIIKDGLIHEILKMEYKGLHVKVYVFNITNSDRFLTGEDHKLKLEEVGPFVYQEYRKNDDIEILPEEGIFRYTPNIWAKFVPEESIGDPKEIILNVPNVPLLAVTSMLSSFPPLIKHIYNLVTLQQNGRAIIKKDVYSFLWDNKDPIISAANRIVPGFVYFENIGLLERLYDRNIVYRMELGATEEDKFKLKWVDKKMRSKALTSVSKVESNKTYVDTYEGMGYPPGLPPTAPRHVFRQGICKTVDMKYIGDEMMDINTIGYAFDFNETNFQDKVLCDKNGTCPHGLLDLSECYFGIPFTLSRGHLKDADPRFLERIEGMNPDPVIHETYFYIEPKVGLIIKGKSTLQLNMVLRDVSYSTRANKFANMAVPMANARFTTPPLPDLIQTKLELLFVTSYKVLMVSEIVSVVIGLALFARAARLIYLQRSVNRTIVFEQIPNPKGEVEVALVY